MGRGKTRVIIYTMSLGLTRGYRRHPPRLQPACPSFSSTAVFLLLHKPPAPSHKKCNEQSGWKRLGMERAAGHSSRKSLRGHGPAAECARPQGPSPGHLRSEGKMGALRHQARNCWLSGLNGPLLYACEVRGAGREASRVPEFRAKVNPMDPKPYSLVGSEVVRVGAYFRPPLRFQHGWWFPPSQLSQWTWK